jgi:hypothetical protein
MKQGLNSEAGDCSSTSPKQGQGDSKRSKNREVLDRQVPADFQSRPSKYRLIFIIKHILICCSDHLMAAGKICRRNCTRRRPCLIRLVRLPHPAPPPFRWRAPAPDLAVIEGRGLGSWRRPTVTPATASPRPAQFADTLEDMFDFANRRRSILRRRGPRLRPGIAGRPRRAHDGWARPPSLHTPVLLAAWVDLPRPCPSSKRGRHAPAY